MDERIFNLLKNHNLRKTAIRKEVLSVFLQHDEALSHADIEGYFEEIDRITLYRTLKTFEERGLIHRAIDGGDKAKYALCSEGCTTHHHADHHAHFHCDDCGKTFCLEGVEPPQVKPPEGFEVTDTQLVLRGHCEACSGA